MKEGDKIAYNDVAFEKQSKASEIIGKIKLQNEIVVATQRAPRSFNQENSSLSVLYFYSLLPWQEIIKKIYSLVAQHHKFSAVGKRNPYVGGRFTTTQFSNETVTKLN